MEKRSLGNNTGEQSATNSGRAFFGGGYTHGGSPKSNAI